MISHVVLLVRQKICDEYAEKDRRVRVFHKENGGVSSARNLGIDNARGEWICFVDSDDWVEKSYLHDFGLDKCEADFYLQGYKVYKDNEIIREHRFCKNHISIVSLKSCFIEAEYKNILNSPWCKLFRGDILRKYRIYYDQKISYGEDHLFVLVYMLHIDILASSPNVSYNYTQDGDVSLSRRLVPPKEMLHYLVEINKHQIEIENAIGYTENLHKVICQRTYENMIATVKSIVKTKSIKIKYFHETRTAFRTLGYGFFGLRFHHKCLQYAFLHFPIIVSYVLFNVYISISEMRLKAKG